MKILTKFKKPTKYFVWCNLAILLTGCLPIGSLKMQAIPVSQTVLNAAGSFTWDFSNSGDYTLDAGLTLASGAVSLNLLDFQFNLAAHYTGTLSGTAVSGDALTLHATNSLNKTVSSTILAEYANVAGYYQFESNFSDSSTHANNGSAVADATYSTTTLWGSRSGTFDGAGDAVSMSAQFTAAIDNFSACLWAQRTGTSASDMILTLNGDDSFDGYGMILKQSNSYELKILIPGVGEIASSYFSNLNQWTHYCMVRDSGNWQLYVDGKSLSIVSSTNPSAPSDVAVIGENFNGRIDEVIWFDTPLSSTSVAFLYQFQRKLYGGIYLSPIFNLGSTTLNQATLLFNSHLPAAKGLPGASGSEVSTDYSSLTNDTLMNNIEALFHFEQTSYADVAGEVIDSSGAGASGRAKGGALTHYPGVLLNRLQLDGTDDYIQVGDTAALPIYNNTAFSVAFWVRAASQNDRRVFAEGDSADIDPMFTIGSGQSNQAKLRVFVRNNAGTIVSTKETITTVFDSNWHHIVYTDNNGTAKVYVDGVLDATDFNYTKQVITITRTAIGALWRSTAANFLLGEIDELALFSRELTATEAQQLYLRGSTAVQFWVRKCATSTCASTNWLGAMGNDYLPFSELSNCTAIVGATGICNFSAAATYLKDAPVFTFSDFTAFSWPSAAYFQYAIILNSDTSTFPVVSSHQFTPDYYYAGTPALITVSPVTFSQLTSLQLTSGGTCTPTLQLSLDGTNFHYVSGGSWLPATLPSHAANASDTNNALPLFHSQVGAGSLYVKILFPSDGTESCSVDELTLNYVL